MKFTKKQGNTIKLRKERKHSSNKETIIPKTIQEDKKIMNGDKKGTKLAFTSDK